MHLANDQYQDGGNDDDDDDDDVIDVHGGPIGAPPSYVYGWNPAEDSTDDGGSVKHVPLAKMAKLNELGVKLRRDRAFKNAQKLSRSKRPLQPTWLATLHRVHTPAAKSPERRMAGRRGTA